MNRHAAGLLVVCALLGCATSESASRATAGDGSKRLTTASGSAQFATPPPAAERAPAVMGSRLERTVAQAAVDEEAEDRVLGDGYAEPPSRSATARTAAGGMALGASEPQPVFAQAPGRQAEAKASEEATEGGDAAAPVATDARSGPLLIYEARLWMAVYEVAAKQAEVIALARELGGFLSQQTGQRLVVRVPADRFEDAIEGIEKIGDVVDRHISAQDVTDQFRDLSLRLKNAEQVRNRLAALLEKAQGVKESLAIEHELDRLTERIEMLKGQLKALSDRIAFSTITVELGVRPQPSIDPEFNLPFGWLQQLGLDTLLSL